MSTAPLRVREAMQAARAAGLDRLDAQSLLAALLARPRSWLLAHDEAPLDPDAAARFQALLARHQAGEPLAYLLGEKEFHGLRLSVTPDVLVPRADTETLVDWALECLPAGQHAARVLDLGSGSGAIALALAYRRPAVRVLATDLSAAALAVAAANGRRLGIEVEWRLGDWFAALDAGQRFELIVSNPPYIAAQDPHLPALACEPELALTSGQDGLDAIRRIAAEAPAWLAPGGWLLLEHGHDQAEAVATLLAAAGLTGVASRRDLAGQLRCTGGRLG